jgi:peptidoglycan/xylan/chitin deacetylase (PgdA/CDA1 family)|nr:polysaccharide deacetylase family protein [Kofleriaceae bacterium]
MKTRERLAKMLFRSGALSAIHELRRVSSVFQQVCILTYHHVADGAESYAFDSEVADATPAQFRRQMELLAKHRTPIGIDELLRALDGGPLPKNPVMVTFDDGYRSCHDVALPILRAVGVRATFFVSTGFITNRRMYWWERIAYALKHARRTAAVLDYPRALPIDVRDPTLQRVLNDLVKNTPLLEVDRFIDGLYAGLEVDWDASADRAAADDMVMTWDQVRALLRAGMDVESHTMHHRVLQTLTPEQLRDELVGSRVELEAQLGQRVRAIAYPVGRPTHRDPHIRDAVAAAGYEVGMTSVTNVVRVLPGALHSLSGVDRFNLPRLRTDRDMSDAMWMAQLALPSLAYANLVETA